LLIQSCSKFTSGAQEKLQSWTSAALCCNNRYIPMGTKGWVYHELHMYKF
jgi:hypothetical protein